MTIIKVFVEVIQGYVTTQRTYVSVTMALPLVILDMIQKSSFISLHSVRSTNSTEKEKVLHSVHIRVFAAEMELHLVDRVTNDGKSAHTALKHPQVSWLRYEGLSLALVDVVDS